MKKASNHTVTQVSGNPVDKETVPSVQSDAVSCSRLNAKRERWKTKRPVVANARIPLTMLRRGERAFHKLPDRVSDTV